MPIPPRMTSYMRRETAAGIPVAAPCGRILPLYNESRRPQDRCHYGVGAAEADLTWARIFLGPTAVARLLGYPTRLRARAPQPASITPSPVSKNAINRIVYLLAAPFPMETRCTSLRGLSLLALPLPHTVPRCWEYPQAPSPWRRKRPGSTPRKACPMNSVKRSYTRNLPIDPLPPPGNTYSRFPDSCIISILHT